MSTRNAPGTRWGFRPWTAPSRKWSADGERGPRPSGSRGAPCKSLSRPRSLDDCPTGCYMSVVAHLPRRTLTLTEEEAALPPEMELTGRRRMSPDERSLAETMYTEFRADPRHRDFVLGCLNCGECTTG